MSKYLKYKLTDEEKFLLQKERKGGKGRHHACQTGRGERGVFLENVWFS